MRVSRLLALAFASAALFSCSGTSHEEKGGSPSPSPEKDSLLKVEIYKILKDTDSVYQSLNKGMYFSFPGEYYLWPDRKAKEANKISDSLRFILIDLGIKSSGLRSLLSSNFYGRVQSFRDFLEDPITMGYLLVRHQVGKSLSYVLTPRHRLNCFLEEREEKKEGNSRAMSAMDYIVYHTRRIHILNDSLGIFKTRGSEISFEDDFFCYFLFKKEGGNWLLDGINTCSKGDEGWKDRKLLGRSFPLTYYRAKKYEDKK